LDGKDIFKFIDGNVAFEMDIEKGIEAGVLVPFIYNGLKDDVDYSDIEWLGNKYRHRSFRYSSTKRVYLHGSEQLNRGFPL
jgi:superfamily II DNA or RNA helicase